MLNWTRVSIAAAALWSWLFGTAIVIAILAPDGLSAGLSGEAHHSMFFAVVTYDAVPAAVLVMTARMLPPMAPVRFGLVLAAKATTASLVSAAFAAYAAASIFAWFVILPLLATALVTAIGTYVLRRGALAGVVLTLAVLAGWLRTSLWAAHRMRYAPLPGYVAAALITVLIVATVSLTFAATTTRGRRPVATTV